MCYRFANIQEEEEFRAKMRALGKVFKDKPNPDKKFKFFHTNGFGHEELPVITQAKPDEINHMYWGLIPAGTKNKEDKIKYWKMGYTLNARSESIFTTWSFKHNIKEHRCLIPATGFFEWREFEGNKYPYLIQVRSKEYFDDTTAFCFAGVYDHWVDKESGEVIDGFAIITTEANPMMKQIHVNLKREDEGGRMPVIVAPEDYNTWLNPDATFEDLERIMQPYPEDQMQAYTISKDITSRKINPDRPETLDYVGYNELRGEDAFNVR